MRVQKIFAHGLGLCAIVALAQTPALGRERTPIPFEEGEPYVHPHIGISVPAALGGIENRGGISFAEDDLNVALSYNSMDGSEGLSIYIYRVTSGSLPVWFAQAQSVILSRPLYASPELAFDVEVITPPGQGVGTGLRAIYDTPKSRTSISTGVAMFAIDGWYVKVRASSATRNSEALRDWMDETVAALTLPKGSASAVVPIADCSVRLKFKGKSKDVKGNELSGLLGGLVSSIAMDRQARSREAAESGKAEGDAPAATPVTYCRDHEVEPGQAVYRPNASMNSYLYAISDSGIGISVSPSILGQVLSDKPDAKPGYSVTLHMEAENISYPEQDRMPRPKRVMEILEANRVTGSVSTWGDKKTMTVTAP